jgi:hypothetical protein
LIGAASFRAFQPHRYASHKSAVGPWRVQQFSLTIVGPQIGQRS